MINLLNKYLGTDSLALLALHTEYQSIGCYSLSSSSFCDYSLKKKKKIRISLLQRLVHYYKGSGKSCAMFASFSFYSLLFPILYNFRFCCVESQARLPNFVLFYIIISVEVQFCFSFTPQVIVCFPLEPV
uniref:Uncharacterized protein n=1 Tax=Cacopsylla melanoneura TaxID=428564 RepID=A0A8D8TTK3_9HEMI